MAHGNHNHNPNTRVGQKRSKGPKQELMRHLQANQAQMRDEDEEEEYEAHDAGY